MNILKNSSTLYNKTRGMIPWSAIVQISINFDRQSVESECMIPIVHDAKEYLCR